MNNQGESNLDEQRLELEQKRCDQDKELKLKELAILSKQSKGSQWIVPIIVALVGGGIGLVNSIVTSQQTLQLERERQKGSLIVEAIKTGDTKAAAANLIFLSNSKLISLTDEQHNSLVEIVGKNPLPSLPPQLSGSPQVPSVDEARGFRAILDGDLEKARTLFGTAYRLFPTYHNVDEIYNEVLTSEVIQAYKTAQPDGKKSIQRDVMQQILDSYSWGMPDDLHNEMKNRLEKESN
jgi:hypothetical protein